MPLDTNNPAQDFTENITFIQDLTKDKLCELLTAATREISELKAKATC